MCNLTTLGQDRLPQPRGAITSDPLFVRFAGNSVHTLRGCSPHSTPPTAPPQAPSFPMEAWSLWRSRCSWASPEQPVSFRLWRGDPSGQLCPLPLAWPLSHGDPGSLAPGPSSCLTKGWLTTLLGHFLVTLQPRQDGPHSGQQEASGSKDHMPVCHLLSRGGSYLMAL